MKHYFLHTLGELIDGIWVDTHPDCDSVPIIRIYRHSDDVLIESPTAAKTTLKYPTGHYRYVHDDTLYQFGIEYYTIVTYVYDSTTYITHRIYFEWGIASSVTGDSDDEYNVNLYRALQYIYELSPTITTLLGHNRSVKATNKIHGIDVIRVTSSQPKSPFMTSEIVMQSGAENVSGNITTLRFNILEARFYSDNNPNLLKKIVDKWLRYMCDSNNYQGMRIRTSDNVFWSFDNISYESTITGPGCLVPYNSEIKLYETGARISFLAKLTIS